MEVALGWKGEGGGGEEGGEESRAALLKYKEVYQ